MTVDIYITLRLSHACEWRKNYCIVIKLWLWHKTHQLIKSQDSLSLYNFLQSNGTKSNIYQPFLVLLAYCLECSSELLSVLYWPGIDGRYRAVVVVVVELLTDEGLLVPWLGVGGGRARLVRLLRHLHRDLDADLPEVPQRRVQAPHLQVSRRHHLG